MANDLPIFDAEADELFASLAREPALVLAISGGPDSTALLWLAARWRKRLKRGPKLIAITIDHGLRRESAREALAVKRLAAMLKVEHRTLRWTGAKPKTGIQEAARNARYRLLSDAAKKVGAEHVVTAHTQDDQAETVLFRMMRGSGLAGLRGMSLFSPLPACGERSASAASRVRGANRKSSSVVSPPHPDPLPAGGEREKKIARPFLSIPKSRLFATLAAAKISFATDPSNRDPRFTRPRLRELMPALAAEGLTAERLALLAERVTRAEIVVQDVLNETLMRLAPGPWAEEGPVTIDAAAFYDLNDEIRLRMLDRLIGWTGNEGPVELGKLEALCTALDGPLTDAVIGPRARSFRRTLAGAMVTLSGAKLTVERAPPRRTAPKKRRSS
jgi:tRNA(Ile)-lysidine synthase